MLIILRYVEGYMTDNVIIDSFIKKVYKWLFLKGWWK